jgi:hypothetical protein
MPIVDAAAGDERYDRDWVETCRISESDRRESE